MQDPSALPGGGPTYPPSFRTTTSTSCCWRRPGCALPVTRPRSPTWLRLGTRSSPSPALQGGPRESLMMKAMPPPFAPDPLQSVENKNSRKLHDIIDMFNLTQSVSEPTHNQGHLLDLVFSKQSDNILTSTKLHYGLTSDHTAILCKLDVSVPVQKPKTFLYRCLKKIDTGAFKQDLSHTVSQVSSISDYNNHLCSVLDKHAPLCRCTVRTRKPTPWFSSIAEQFCELKRERRQAERRWLKSKLTVHKQIYDSIKQIVTNLVDKAKQAYYSAKIQSSTTCKQLFQNFNTILGKSRSSPLPSTLDSDDLPNVFSDYFTEKIRTIKNNFPPPNPTACPDTAFAGNPLLTFESVTDEFVLKIINSASAKSCELDPIPTTLLYENLDILLPTITNERTNDFFY